MKKTIHPTRLPHLMLGFSGIGMVLRIWLLQTEDAAGLIADGHFAGIATWILTFIAAAGLFLLTQPLMGRSRPKSNFPRSVTAAAGCFILAAGIFVDSIGNLVSNPAPDRLLVFLSILGILSGLCLLLAGFCRYKGAQATFLVHVVVMLFFALRLFDNYRHWSSESQFQIYAFSLLAGGLLALTTYYRAAFDVKLGKRRIYAFLSLMTFYFCCLSIPGSPDKLFYITAAIWLFTNLCSLKPGKPRPKQLETEAEAPQQEEAPREPVPADPELPTEEPAEMPSLLADIPELADMPDLTTPVDAGDLADTLDFAETMALLDALGIGDDTDTSVPEEQ